MRLVLVMNWGKRRRQYWAEEIIRLQLLPRQSQPAWWETRSPQSCLSCLRLKWPGLHILASLGHWRWAAPGKAWSQRASSWRPSTDHTPGIWGSKPSLEGVYLGMSHKPMSSTEGHFQLQFLVGITPNLLVQHASKSKRIHLGLSVRAAWIREHT